MTSENVDFYFDFLSPYGYFGSTQVDQLEQRYGRKFIWRVYLVGAAFKVTGAKSAGERSPIQQQYGLADIIRCAQFYGVPFKFPKVFGTSIIPASRAFYYLFDQDHELAKSFAKEIYAKVFAEQVDMRAESAVAALLKDLGHDGDLIMDWAGREDGGKKRLREETDQAIARGAFGSPFFFVDQQKFWGADRLPQLEWWLATQGSKPAKVIIQ